MEMEIAIFGVAPGTGGAYLVIYRPALQELEEPTTTRERESSTRPCMFIFVFILLLFSYTQTLETRRRGSLSRLESLETV